MTDGQEIATLPRRAGALVDSSTEVAAMRIEKIFWRQIFVVIAMVALTGMIAGPDSAAAAARKQGREHAASLTGRWAWRAICPRGQYRGAAFIAQHSVDRFSGRL